MAAQVDGCAGITEAEDGVEDGGETARSARVTVLGSLTMRRQKFCQVLGFGARASEGEFI